MSTAVPPASREDATPGSPGPADGPVPGRPERPPATRRRAPLPPQHAADRSRAAVPGEPGTTQHGTTEHDTTEHGARPPGDPSTTDPAAHGRPGPARTTPQRRAEAVTYGLAVAITTVATVVALRLWNADPRVPFTYWGDAIAVAAHFKTVLETGWYEHQPLLGAPVGQAYHDFPTADNLNFAAAKVLGWFTSHFGFAMNLYYLAGFALSALTATWFLRVCGVSRTMTVPLAVLFALAPYHFARGEGHLWLASYFTVPAALVAVVRVLRGEPIWTSRRPGGRGLRRVAPRGLVTAVTLVAVSSGASYYGVFVAVLLAAAGLVAFVRDRDVRRFLGAVAGGVVLAGTVVANVLPDLLYARANGPSAAGFVREPSDVEIYALKLTQLILPIPGHRLEPWAELRREYDSEYPMLSENPALGTVAAIGLLCALALVVFRVAAPALGRVRASGDGGWRETQLAHLSVLVLVAFLFSTTGGFATIISFFTSSLRGWNRIVIVIAMLCLAVVGLVVDAALERRRRRTGPHAVGLRPVAVAVAGVVLVGGWLDQTTVGTVPDYAGSAARFASDEQWVSTVEDVLPAGAMVFQLPHAGFPETPPVNRVLDSDQLRPYLHSTTLRWSGGGIKGRATSDWPALVAAKEPRAMVADLAAAGFAAIMVDRQAYGPTSPDLEAALSSVAGPPVAVSADDRFTLFSLAAAAERLRAMNPPELVAEVGEAVVEPVMVFRNTAEDVTVPDDPTPPDWAFVEGEDDAVVIDNGTDEPLTVHVSAGVVAPEATGPVDVHIGDTVLSVPMVDGVGRIDQPITIGPDQTVVRVELDGLPAVSLSGLRAVRTDVPALRF